MSESDMLLSQQPENIEEEYKIAQPCQSTSSFFHFMDKIEYLIEMLNDKKIYPRFCVEDISYLRLDIKQIGIAMKCFCNTPLHMIKDHKFEYGGYCIGFDKQWGVKKQLQPVIYYNEYSSYPSVLKMSYEAAMKYGEDDELLTEISALLNHNFKYIKAVDGTDKKTGNFKDFTDENEWRYVPDIDDLDFGEIIVEQSVVSNTDILKTYNDVLKKSKYHLDFQYEDIKYLFVKDEMGRKQLIEYLKTIDCSDEMRYKLMTKICVWEEMEGDF